MSSIPSIALIPSGYEPNKLYCQLPSNGDADLTTSRAGSATRVAQNGVVETVATGVPILDYTNGSCAEWLLQPQRRNLIPYSEDFTRPEWTSLSTATLSATTTIAPDGSQNAVKVTATGPSDQLAEVVPVTSGQTYTGSIWVRRVTGSGNISLIDVNNGFTIINPTSEWQRFSVTATATSTNGRLYVRISDVGDEIECWGAQLEDNGVLGGGDYMTSYIRTNGSSVTRIADEVTGNSSLGNVINSSEGVFYVEMSALADDGTNRFISLSDGSNNNEVRLYFESTSNTIGFNIRASAVDILSGTSTAVPSTLNSVKLAVKYKSGDISFYVNGLNTFNSSNAFVFGASLIKLALSRGGGSLPFYGRIKELRVYNTALTDAQLQTLTNL